METDADLMQRCLEGDLSAFDTLVSRYQQGLFRYLLRLAGNREDAEDLCQETFIRFYRALPRFQCDRKVAPFLLKIATNAWRKGLRRRQEARRQQAPDEIADPRLVVDEAFGMLERQVLLAAVARLRPEYRQVVSLRYDQGLSYREIADALGIPPGTVATWLDRALDLLRDSLQVDEVPR